MGPIFDQSYNGIIVLSFWPFNYEQLRERDSTNDGLSRQIRCRLPSIYTDLKGNKGASGGPIQ